MVRLSDVMHILTYALAVCSKVSALKVQALAMRVEAEALALSLRLKT